jgi:hypothetical protein
MSVKHFVTADGKPIGTFVDGAVPPDGAVEVSVLPPVVPTQAEQEANRKAAYTAEADPLFFMSQRGEATVEEWQAKVAEIKARYPYPEETQA